MKNSLPVSQLNTALGPLVEHGSMTGDEVNQLACALNTHGKRCVRPRPGISAQALPFDTHGVAWAATGRFLDDSQIRPGAFLEFAAGDYAIQDAASLLPITLMQLKPGQAVCDLCAAPGGKSTAILEQLQGQGILWCNEAIASRVDTLQLACARTGYANYLISNELAPAIAEAGSQQFDCVLVDAPCTGQSMVARGKQTLSAFSEHQIQHSAARQRTILSDAVSLVRPGGRLIYSTCTFAYLENEAVVEWLLSALPEWKAIDLPELNEWRSPLVPGCYRLWPHRDHCAGGFAAGLVRPPNDNRSSAELSALLGRVESESPQAYNNAVSRSRSKHHWQSDSSFIPIHEWGEWREASTPQSQPTLWSTDRELNWFNPAIESQWRELAISGVDVAQRFGEHWQPAYALATLQDIAVPFAAYSQIDLSRQQAIQYLTGTSLHGIAAEAAEDASWRVVRWEGRPLGWGKQVGSQLKNHLPKPLRQPSLR